MVRRVAVGVSAVVCLVAGVFVATGASQQAWVSRAETPTAHFGTAGGVLNGLVHVVGGSNTADCSALTTHEVYDPIADAWTTAAPMLVHRTHPAGVVMNNGVKDLFYVLGGSTGCSTRTATMEAFDPDTGAWSFKAPMPLGERGNMGVAVVNGLLYVFGGITTAEALTDRIEIYDPVADAWLPTPPPMPHVRYSMAIGAIDGIIYLAGGSNGVPDFRNVDAFDPVTGLWTSRAPLSLQRAYPTSVVSNGRLVVIGGESATFHDTVEIYDPLSNTWSAGPVLPAPRADAAGVTAAGSIHAIGGFNGASIVTTTLALQEGAPGPDTTAPITQAVSNPSANADGWIKGPATATLTAHDGPFGSGVASLSYVATGALTDAATVPGNSVTLSLPDGDTTFVFHATDNAGNVEADRTATFRVDSVPPSIAPIANITQTATSSSGAFVSIPAPNATDAGSGLQAAGCNRTSGFFPLGSTPVACTATDRAGHTTTIGFTVTVGAQPGYRLLTIHLNGLGNPPITGVVSVIPNGELCGNSGGTSQCTYQYPSGTSLRMTSNAPNASTPGAFSQGTGSASACATSSCTFAITQDSEVTTTFDPNAPVVRLTMAIAGDAGGEVGIDNGRCQNYDYHPSALPTQASACVESYAPHSVATVQAAAPVGTRFSGYSQGTLNAAACGTSGVCSFTLDSDTTLTASFSMLTAISVAPASATVTVNQSQSFTARGSYTDGTVNEAFPQGRMGTWTTKASMSQRRFNFAAAAAAGRVYAIGGLDGSNFVTGVETYDPASNTWTGRHAINPRASLAAGTIGDRYIYAVGGDVAGACPVDTLEVYDTANDASGWAAAPPMPGGPRRFLSAAVVGNTLYAIGGELNACGTTSGTVLNRVEAFDSSNGTWTTKAPMPTARRFFGAAVVNGIIYAAGGDDTNNNLATVEAYDPATDTWTPRAPLPSARSLLAVAAIDNVLYAIGGNNGQYSSLVFAYDPVANTWSNKAFMPSVEDLPMTFTGLTVVGGQRAELAAASLGGRIYAMGGLVANNQPPVAIVTAFEEHLIWSASQASVASIQQTGLATGRQPGQTTIRARAGTQTCDNPPGCATLTVINAAPNTPPAVTIFGPSSVTINAGQSLSKSGSFSDPDASQFWNGTVNYGDNSGTQGLPLTIGSDPLGPRGTFSFSHIYMNPGTYTATVTVTDSAGAPGTATVQVTVNPSTPPSQIFLNTPNSAFTQVNNANWGCGSFRDTNAAGGHWSATINYGDGSGTQTLTLTIPAPAPPAPCVPSSGTPPTGTFVFNHAYSLPSPPNGYQVSLTVTNTDTHVSASRTFPVTVAAGQIFLGLPNSVSTQVNNASWGCGSFFDQGGSGHWSGTVDYGDGSGPQPLTLMVPPPVSGPCSPQGGGSPPTGVFAFNHAYTAPSPVGGYPVSVTVTNTDTHVSKSGGFTVTVTAPCAQISLTLTGSVPFSSVPVTISVTANGQTQSFDDELPLGTTAFTAESGEQGVYRVVFHPPAGYEVVPSEWNFSVVCGTNVSQSAVVRVRDTTPPAIGSVAPSTASLWPPNHKMVAIGITAQATDDSGAAPACTVASVGSSEPVNGTGDGDTAPDWAITGPLSIELRAERAGNGPGRVYTITVQCTDGAGNASTATTTVSVPHNQ